MSSTNKTTYYELPQFVDSDLFNPLVDDNDAYSKIDTALHNIAEAETGDASEIVGVKSRVTTAEGKITALETQNGVEALTTTAQTLSGAVNELDADIASLDDRLDVVEDNINNANTGLKAKVADLGTRMTTAESDINSLDNRVDDTENAISILTPKVNALQIQNGNNELDTISNTLSGSINELNIKKISTFNVAEKYSYINDFHNNGICHVDNDTIVMVSYGNGNLIVDTIDALTGTVNDTVSIVEPYGVNDVAYFDSKLYLACGSHGLYTLPYPAVSTDVLTRYELPSDINTNVWGIAIIDENTMFISDGSKPQILYKVVNNAIVDYVTMSTFNDYDASNVLTGGLSSYKGYIFAFISRPNLIKIYNSNLKFYANAVLNGGASEYIELEGISVNNNGDLWICNFLPKADGKSIDILLVANVLTNGYINFPFSVSVADPYTSLANYYSVSSLATPKQNGRGGFPYGTIEQALLQVKSYGNIKRIRMHSDNAEFTGLKVYNVCGVDFTQRSDGNADLFVDGTINNSKVVFNGCKFKASPEQTVATLKVEDSDVSFFHCTFIGNSNCDGVKLRRSTAHFANSTFTDCTNKVNTDTASLCAGDYQ